MPPSPTRSGATPFSDIERALARGPLTAGQLAAALGLGQPAVARAFRAHPQALTRFKLKGERAPYYAALRRLPLGLNPRQPIYRFLNQGKALHFADVEFLAGGATLERTGEVTTLYDGLPPYMAFAAPSGFLGRQVAQALEAQAGSDAASAWTFPASLRDWDDTHRIAYLFSQGLNLPGNLVFGAASLQKEGDLRQSQPIAQADRLSHYAAMATAMQQAAFGSSAGGEQPKFLSLVEGAGHVIVKFARRGSRMAELLPLEHLALQALHDVGVPAARTRLLASGEHVFLEVARFDRQGLNGRVGMLSAGAVDDEYFGRRDHWSAFAERCVKAGYLRAGDARHIDTMAAFSELIGNNDRHFENLALLIDETGEYQGVAPAYDILPMRYASLGAGVDPDLLPIQPSVGGIGPQTAIWAAAGEAAERFWSEVMSPNDDQLALLVPSPMRGLAAQNLAVVRAFTRPLLSA